MSATDLNEWLTTNGYIAGAELADGQVIAELRTVIGAGQLIRGTRQTVKDRWSYPTLFDATVAFVEWQARGFTDEPTGWIRHQPSDRRRTNGDPSREYIAP